MDDLDLVPQVIARGARGAVVAPHHLATAAGLAVLRAGGNAVDAAIATNAALAVVMPSACGIGGDAFWLIWDETSGELSALNGSGRAPSGAATPERGSDSSQRLPLRGPLSVTIPGAVHSWGDAYERYGRLGRAEVLAPAIELARGGFPAWPGFARAVEVTHAVLDAQLGPEANGWNRLFRPAGRPWRIGELVRFTALAATLERLATHGFADYYQGDLAERQVAGLTAAGVPLVADDLRGHTSTWCEPIATDYRGTSVVTHRPNSQGFVALEMLNILACFDPPTAADFSAQGCLDPRWIHLGIEAARLAFADRDEHLTDPDTYDMPLDRLLSADHARALAASIDPGRASPPRTPRNPPGGGTIYLATADADGNAVSLIESNYSGFGSGVADPETGIHYQNRGSYFSLDPDHVNVLAPGKRTLHTLMPGMLLRGGRPALLVGSMGGDAQPQIMAQVVSALIDGGVSVGRAVAGPRWFVQPAWHFEPPLDVRIESRAPESVAEGLAARGHPVTPVEAYDSLLGHCHAIELVDGGPAQGGSYAAVTDPRSEGLPATY